jgi:hypothetical protein
MQPLSKLTSKGGDAEFSLAQEGALQMSKKKYQEELRADFCLDTMLLTMWGAESSQLFEQTSACDQGEVERILQKPLKRS